MFHAFSKMMKDSGEVVVVRLFQMNPREEQDVVQRLEVCDDVQEGAGGNVRFLFAFKWNGLPHFDVLHRVSVD